MGAFLTGAWLAFQSIYSVALYLAIAFSLYHIGRNNGVRHAWLAFVPIVQYSIIGSLCEEYVLWGIRIRPLSLVMVGLELLQAFLGFFGRGFFVLQMAINLLLVLILHKFFYLFDPRKALLYSVLSLLGRIPVAIFLFLLKDRVVCMSAGAYPYPFAERR